MSETLPQLHGGAGRRLLELMVIGQFVAIVGWTILVSLRSDPDRAAPPPVPTPSWQTFRDGSYATQVEGWTQEHLPAIAKLKSSTLTAHFLLGIEETSYVELPVPGWVFAERTLSTTPRTKDLTERRAFLQSLAPRIAAFEGQVWAMVVPDKGRIYPELAWPTGEVPERRRVWFDTLLADLAAVGIHTVDPRAPLRAARERYPLTLVYARTDTHWNVAGSSLAARLLIDRLPLRPRVEGLAPHTHFEWVHGTMSQSDLNANARGFAIGPLDAWLRERVDSMWLCELSASGDLQRRSPDHPDAPIAVAGDSFCAKVVPPFVVLSPVTVDTSGVEAATNPWKRLAAMLTRIENGELRPEFLILIGSEWLFSAQPSDPARMFR